jgi:hypothetical protein
MRAIHGLVSMGFNPSSATVFFCNTFHPVNFARPRRSRNRFAVFEFYPPVQFYVECVGGASCQNALVLLKQVPVMAIPRKGARRRHWGVNQGWEEVET